MRTPIHHCARALPVALRLAAFTLAFSLAAAPSSAQTLAIVSPPAGSGGSLARVYGVNANGTAAAGYADNSSSQDIALRWTNLTNSQSMGLLPGGTFNSYAQAIDASGTILAGYGDSGSSRAFRWTNSGGYQLIPVAAGTSPSNFNLAYGISQNGNIVVGTSGSGSGARAFIWNASSPGSSLALPVLPSQSSSGAAAVSGDGTTVVGSSGSRAFKWTSPGGMVDLGSLPGQVWALGEAVNTDGSVITGRYNNGLGEFGYRWTPATGMVALPQTPNGCTALRPRAVNGDGTVIIGQVVDNVAGFTAFVWTPALGTRLLSEHLQLRAVNLTGLQITDATGISADGSAMCGHGIYNGNAVGWVVRNLPCANLNSPLALFGSSGCVGGNAVFDINFSYQIFTMPSWRWWKDGVLLAPGLQPSGSTISNYNSNQLTITNMQPGDAGNYQVGISAQGACEVVSAPLFFAGPGVLGQNIQPTPTSACVGQNPFLFSVPTSNVPPSSVVYRWQKLVTPPNIYADIFDGPTGNGSTYNGTGTSTFSILNVQPADGTRYRCVFSILGCGASGQIVSNNALLTINPTTDFLAQPSDTSVCPGDNDAQFSVTATPLGGPFTYQWQRKNPFFLNVYNDIFDGPTGNGGSYGGTNTPTLTIAGAYPGDFEYYRCVVTGPCGGPVASNDAFLSPTPEASIDFGPVGGEGCQGGDASMTVYASPPGSTYQWQKYVGPCILCYQNIANGPTGNGGTFSGAQSPTLTINGLDLFDTVTTYRCIVTGPCGITPAASPDWTFTLLSQPVIQTGPVGGVVCKNGTKQFAVTLAPGGYGSVTYQWWRYVPAFPIFAGVPAGTLPSGAIATGPQSPTLTISNFKPQDAGQYYCQITGDCGVTNSAVVSITVCSADFDCNGTVGVADLFAFLDAWFAQFPSGIPAPPSADFDDNGAVGVADLFGFLDAWFMEFNVCGF